MRALSDASLERERVFLGAFLTLSSLTTPSSSPRTSAMTWFTWERDYMIQPLVELYRGCMVVLKVSWYGITPGP